ncbi:hypothetical protein CY34DRAFT_18582 [Suillus luteus UH-Slu-Lm8-n1]|uniref:MARVEL domain-containing protein n=1 Tax=Suillus luteus UH-Slu-Lm8-n1 TaxID=930992 RepID=A0A0C9Z6H5_9AGAM|nr:hypothetical protein CY34DRAFT_18582 [Suillus luteus UH-Slu-Lm8-n1]
MGFITESFLVLSAVLSVLALSVFPIVTCGRISEIGNTTYLIIFGALCLLNIPSCITLTFRAVQGHATALCQDLSESDDCTLAHVFIGFYYTSVILAIIGFVITCINRRAGSAPEVLPHYPNARATGPPFGVAAFQYPQDVELENVNVITELPARKAKLAHAERSSESPV